jgi:hypothetical protein
MELGLLEFAHNRRAVVGFNPNFVPSAVGKLLNEDAVTHIDDRKPLAEAPNRLKAIFRPIGTRCRYVLHGRLLGARINIL